MRLVEFNLEKSELADVLSGVCVSCSCEKKSKCCKSYKKKGRYCKSCPKK